MADPTGDAQATGTEDGSLEHIASLLDRKLAQPGDSADASEDGDKSNPSESETDESDDGEAEQGESEESDEQDEAQEQPQKIRVKVADAEEEVTLDELKKGYSREADYTRKTMALSEEKKAFEAQKQSAITEATRGIEQEREQYRAVLGYFEREAMAALGTEEELEQLRRTDPNAYAVKVADRTRTLQRLQNLQAEQDRLQREEQQKSQSIRLQRANEEAKKLVEARPEWKDPAKLQDGMKAIVAYAESRGYTQADINAIEDHRVFLALADAAAYRALQNKKPQPVVKPEAVKTVTPGVAARTAKPQTEVAKAHARLAKTGHINDLAAALRARGIA